MTLPARAGEPPVAAFTYDPPERPSPSGALVYIHGGGHGGGMILGGPRMSHATCTRLARGLGLFVDSVDYRLAPEDPFPAGPEDCYTTLAWLHADADRLDIDPNRVGVAGDSAGGGLSAMVAQMAHDRGLPLAFQGLIYPMLDDRTALRDDHGTRGALLWTPAHNRAAWGWFLGHEVTDQEDRPDAAGARRADVSGLAPAWIGVGDADLFHDEDLEYARRLESAGVPVELIVVPGMPHAADADQRLPGMKDFRDSFIAAVDRHLNPQRV